MVIRVLLALLLLAGAARADSLQVVVPKVEPVVGEMIPVTLRGEYTSMITLEKVVFPDSADYDWIQLTRDAWSEERIAGRTVKVFQRRIGVYPRRPGTLAIGPVVHHLTVVGRSSPREALDIEAPPVTVDVAPYPADGVPLTARDLDVEDRLSTDPGALRDGETLIRRVSVRADGALAHLLPARPAMREPWLISFTAPERRITNLTPDGPVTTVTWEWSLRPRTGEPGVLPAYEFAWFDTRARRMRIAEIPAIPFGYASFGDNLGGAGVLSVRQVALAAGALGLGLLVGLAGGLNGLSPRGPRAVARALRRLSPVDPTRRDLKRAARSGDLVAVRRAAARYLRRRAELGYAVTGRETAALDKALHGPSGPGSLTASQAAAEILAHRS